MVRGAWVPGSFALVRRMGPVNVVGPVGVWMVSVVDVECGPVAVCLGLSRTLTA